MNVIRYPAPRAFLDAVEPFLLRDEATHNLLLGVPSRMIVQASAGAAAPDVYLAAAVDHGEPAAAAMITPPHRLVLSQASHPAAISALARDVATLRPSPPGVQGPDPVAARFAVAWEQLTGQQSRLALRERIHRLDAVRPLPAAPGRLRSAASDDRPVLLEWLRAFGAEAFGNDTRPPGEAERVLETRLATPGEGFVLWEDGGPRCVAGYGGPTRHGVRVGPVYTPPEHRGRGYGTSCVAALSQRLLDGGRRFCMLFTDLANEASNRIYGRIGYEPVCDVADYRFVKDAQTA